jgi:hypothetical protein
MKIMKYRLLAPQAAADDETAQRITALVADWSKSCARSTSKATLQKRSAAS